MPDIQYVQCKTVKKIQYLCAICICTEQIKICNLFFPLADEEFDELCFEFGLELDEIVCIRYFLNILCLSSLHFIFVTLRLD